MSDLRIGRPRFFRPVCIQHRHGFYGGPAGYEETDDPNVGPLIIQATETGEPPVQRVEKLLDARENQER